MSPTIWIHCPICGCKTRTKVYEDTAINIRQDVFGEDITCKITIKEMGFGLARTKVPNTDYTYYYVSALVLYGAADYYGKYSGTYFENWSVDDQDLVWINAVDGSIIDAA